MTFQAPLRISTATAAVLGAAAFGATAEERPFASGELHEAAVALFREACLASAPDFSGTPAVLAGSDLAEVRGGFYRNGAGTLFAALTATPDNTTRDCGIGLSGGDERRLATGLAEAVAETWPQLEARAMPETDAFTGALMVFVPGEPVHYGLSVLRTGTDVRVLQITATAPLGFE